MTNRETLMKKLAAAKFALWEIHLYLDTHPEDITMLAASQKYETKFKLLENEYEEKYGALSVHEANGVEWLKNPWPWDSEVCD